MLRWYAPRIGGAALGLGWGTDRGEVDMKYGKILALGGVIAVVAATAILVPSIASGDVFTPPGLSQIVTEDGDSPGSESPGNGNGKAWGHNKDSEDFPGNNGNGQGNGHGRDKEDKPGKSENSDD